MTTTIDFFKYAREVVTFRAGEEICAAGQPGNVMYVVQQGMVEISHRQRRLAIVGPGEIVGEMALIDRGPRSATAIAHTDCTLVPLDAQRFTYLVQSHPYFALQVMQVLVERLRVTIGDEVAR